MLFKTAIDLQKEYVLTTHSAKQASQVMVELEKLGISNIRVTKVDHTKIEEYKSQVRINATKSAREKAEGIAKALNQEIGRAIHISEQEPVMDFSRNYTAQDRYYSLKATGAVHRAVDFIPENESPNVNFETIKIEYNIFVKFELK